VVALLLGGTDVRHSLVLSLGSVIITSRMWQSAYTIAKCSDFVMSSVPIW
jgi:hypothetical protein